MVELWAEGLRRGDECHNRNVASSAAVLARLAPSIVAAADRQDAVDVLTYMAANPHFFLALSIAAAKAVADVVHRSGDPGVVTAMSSNGASLGIRVSGAGDRWFLTDSRSASPSCSRATSRPTPHRCWAIRSSPRPSAWAPSPSRRRRPSCRSSAAADHLETVR